MTAKNIALFPGVFDPFTVGHESLVKRTLHFADEVLIAIGVNANKKSYFPVDLRVKCIREIFKNEPRVRVGVYSSLTAEYAKTVDASYIVRGVRSFYDFEYEKAMAEVNRKLSGIETVILFTEPEYSHISSSLVRQLIDNKADISTFVSENIIKLIKQ